MVTETSKAAYSALKAKNLSEKQNEVLQAMHYGSQTRRELAKKMCEEASSIAGRINELIDMGMVYVNGKRFCTVTGNKVESITLTTKGAAAKSRDSWSPDARQANMARGSVTSQSANRGSAQVSSHMR